MRIRPISMVVGLLGVAWVTWAPPSLAQAPEDTFSVDTKGSTLTYHLVHKLHKVDGVSHTVEGRARLLPSGQAQVQMIAKVETFDSGNANRDEHMKETIEAAKYPTVEVKAVADGVTPPTSYPATVEKTFKARITFHGVQNNAEIPVKLTFDSATRVRAQTAFSISLDAYKVERPSLMFVKVNDDLKIDANVTLAK